MCEHLWDSISSDSVIKAWASELKQLAAESSDPSEWSMVGHGVVIEHDHPLDFKAYLPLLGKYSGFAIVNLSAEQVLDSGVLAEATKTNVPTIIYLEPGYWLSETIGEDEDRGFSIAAQRDEEHASRMRKFLIENVFKDVSDKPIVFVVSLKFAQQIDDSLRVAGLFDRKIRFPRLERINHADALVLALGQENVDDSMLAQLERVGLILEDDFPDTRRRELLMTALRRMSWRQKRQLSIRDLIEFTIYGTIEEDQIALDQDTLRESAIHEAGHAVMGYLDSENHIAPIYCAVGKRGNMTGVVMRQCSSYKKVSENETFKEVIHSIRVCLAGRVAEELVLGLEHTSGAAASEDLKDANKQAYRLFAKWGYPEHKGTESNIGSNISIVIGQPTISEYQYIESLIRDFLQQQYQQVMTILTEHRGFLEFVANAIASKGILLQAEFEALVHEWFSSQDNYKVA